MTAHHAKSMNTKQRITVLLADDHKVIRKELRKMLEVESDLEVVGVTDHFNTVCRSQINPDKNDLYFRSLTVKSPHSHHKIFAS